MPMDLEQLRNKIRGPVFPIVTPFTHDFRLDLDKIREYIDYLYAGGARIFHIMVHTSRFGLLTYDEMQALNRTVASHVKRHYSDCVVIAADPLYKPTQISVDFAKSAEDSGADIIGLIFMERLYFDDQVYDFFETVARSCNIGILIHEQQLNTIHGTTLVPFPLELLKRIAGIDNVIAIKEDAKDDQYTHEVVSALRDHLAIIVSGGSKEQFMQFGPMGCQAYLVGVASFDPEIALTFYKAYEKKDTGRCWEIINTLERPFFEVSKRLGWHIGLKSAMELLGIMSRIERPPLAMLPEKNHQEIRDILFHIGYGPRIANTSP